MASLPLGVTPSAGAANERLVKGSYCPLPAPGEVALCLGEAQAEYDEFFAAIGRGALDDAAAARVEADLLSAERAHMALSSLAYGYYELARAEAAQPGADPALVARLLSWNELLTATYASAEPLRGALREAAADLDARAPRVSIDCEGSDCSATGSLSEAFAAIDSATGVRGPLVRLWQRWVGPAEGGP